jgi:uncharacterized protein (TIRG00374 family)
MVLIVWRAPGEALLGWMGRRQGKLADLAPKLREAFDSLRIVASPGALLWPSLLSVVGWGGEGYALYLLVTGFGVTTNAPLCMFFYATATLAGAVIPVPGGLGVAEAMIQEQLVRIGNVAHGAATSAMILIRFATLWWAVVVGFIALGVLRARFPALRRSGMDEVVPAS